MPGAPVSLACWVGIPGTLSAYYFENELQTSESNNNFQENWKKPKNVLLKKKKKFKGLQKICFVTKGVSVQGAPVSLACWVGIPIYIVFIVSFKYHRLKYQSQELLSPSRLLSLNPSL